ncbi:MAG: DDE-type integrase/transposase/recombinase [Saprospiraceae bacterium]|nr:DDE-type integrase/transposase/recombinase [Candidatus Brachybacter algidus]MBK8747331.1 DDE-type integrase/transposase/recombinase [Candidatus Brachybacter algidus]
MGRDKFEQFCKENGLTSPRLKITEGRQIAPGVIRFVNLLVGLEIHSMDRVWQSDITYFEIRGRFYYITFIIDSYTRRIVGHSTSFRLLTIHTTIPALQMAIKTRADKCLGGLLFLQMVEDNIMQQRF